MGTLRVRGKSKDNASAAKSRKGPPTPSSRYTPPIPKEYRHSPRWVPIVMFGLFALGFLIIILNYFPDAPLLPGDSNNRNLIAGLVMISGGFVAATRYH